MEWSWGEKGWTWGTSMVRRPVQGGCGGREGAWKCRVPNLAEAVCSPVAAGKSTPQSLQHAFDEWDVHKSDVYNPRRTLFESFLFAQPIGSFEHGCRWEGPWVLITALSFLLISVLNLRTVE